MSEIKGIFKEARNCKRCYGDVPIHVPRPDPKNGFENVKIIFINERPGRIGTGESGYISFENNDPSAHHFHECFESLKISRTEIFISNACICHPTYEGYIDRAPSQKEIKNCHFWLERQLKAVNPKLIVTLGNIPLKSLKLFFKNSKQLKNFTLKNNVGVAITDTKPWIYPLYHTSLRARLTRNTEQQKKDWLKIVGILKEIESKRL
ncbi:MAG: hypothetical protein KJ646_06170 [Nanoarchaeota archaeon]|nr:hypothetical protein [Nanoarchaeota archaeon]